MMIISPIFLNIQENMTGFICNQMINNVKKETFLSNKCLNHDLSDYVDSLDFKNHKNSFLFWYSSIEIIKAELLILLYK